MAIKKKHDLGDSLPKFVYVFGKKIPVIITSLKDLHGDFNLETNEIRISKDYDLESAKSTLFHECLHAALAISGQNELLNEKREEALVRMLEHAFAHSIDFDKLSLDKQ